MNRRTKFGLWVSAIWMIGLLALTTYRWYEISRLQVNNLGDFLAGAFSPLAFLWLILGYLQQGEELAQNTKALTLQAEELRHAVKEYEQLNDTNKRHLSLLEAEATQRARAEADRYKMRLAHIETQFSAKGTASCSYLVDFRNMNHEGTNVNVLLNFPNADLKEAQFARLKSQEFLQLTIFSRDFTERSGVLSFAYVDGQGENDIITFDVFMLPEQRLLVVRSGSDADAVRETFGITK